MKPAAYALAETGAADATSNAAKVVKPCPASTVTGAI
jgi:hypothetical protein